jgi:protease IV
MGTYTGSMRHACVLALLLSTLAGCSVISVDLSPPVRPLEEKTVEGKGRAKILMMDVSGLISEEGAPRGFTIGTPPPHVPLLVRFREELIKARKDHDVRAVVLRINSPGGTVTASDIMYRELELFRRDTKVPVVAVMMDLAASGGYYLALAADSIVAHPTTVTGSIGVIMMSVNAEGLMQKIGLSPVTIKSGERKDMGSPFRQLTPEERAIFQSVINGLYGQFVDKVAERRGIPLEAARALGDGRVYTAQQALAEHLIDRIGYVPDALELARQAAGVTEARVVVYHRPRQYRATYYAQSTAPEPGLEQSLARLAGLVGPGPNFLYLWWP